MKKCDYRNMKPAGQCPICGINCWTETNNQPAIWPCGIEACPYPKSAKIIEFPKSLVGNSLAQITYSGA